MSSNFDRGHSGNLSSPPQSIAEVLHFVQREWTSFHLEKSKWQEERASMQHRINSLEGELEANRRLRRDLIRRIKMLELVIKKERAKSKGSATPQLSEKDRKELQDADLPERQPLKAKLAKVKEGRQILMAYLREVGVSKSLIEIQASRLKNDAPSFMDLITAPSTAPSTGVASEFESEADDDYSDGSQEPISGRYILQRSGRQNEQSLSSTKGSSNASAFLDVFSFLDDENSSGDSDEEEDYKQVLERSAEQASIKRRHLILKRSDEIIEEHQHDQHNDVSDDKRKIYNDADDNSISLVHTAADNANIEYKNEFSGDGGDLYIKHNNFDADNCDNERQTNGKALVSKNFSRKERQRYLRRNERLPARNLFGMKTTDELGELANVHVDDEPVHDDEKLPIAVESETGTLKARRDWRLSFCLKSHLRPVRCVAMHSEDPLVLTGGDDNLVKVWWIPVTHDRKANFSMTPSLTLRGHTGPVRSIVLLESENHCLSASDDGTIRCWMLPEEDFDSTDAYTSFELFRLDGHNASVTSIAHRRGSHILSCGNDGTCRSWNLKSKDCEQIWKCADGIPTRVHVLNHDLGKAVILTNTAMIYILQTETMEMIRRFDPATYISSSSTTEGNIDDNDDSRVSACPLRSVCVSSHFTSPLAAVGFSDHHIRVFDTESGDLVQQFCAHTSPVTSVDFCTENLLLSTAAGASSNIRLWNSESFTCVEDMSAHRSGEDGSVLDGTFNRIGSRFVTVGSEGTARVYE
eukprot:gene9414-1659_t